MTSAALSLGASDLLSLLEPSHQEDTARLNQVLETMTAQERIRWGLEHLPHGFMLSSSFGIQAAVMLHMVTQQFPDIPVVVTDTGYLFPETYQFIDQLTDRLKLNLKVYRAELSPAWQESRFGQLWQQGEQGLKHYNQLNKLEPMRRAQRDLSVKSWFAGLRRTQSDSRGQLPVLQPFPRHFKVHPIVDWSDKDVHYYLREHDLPYHPLREQNYVSLGDWHTTKPLEPGMSEQDTRFFGIKRECGLHEAGFGSNEQGDGI